MLVNGQLKGVFHPIDRNLCSLRLVAISVKLLHWSIRGAKVTMMVNRKGFRSSIRDVHSDIQKLFLVSPYEFSFWIHVLSWSGGYKISKHPVYATFQFCLTCWQIGSIILYLHWQLCTFYSYIWAFSFIHIYCVIYFKLSWLCVVLFYSHMIPLYFSSYTFIFLKKYCNCFLYSKIYL